MQFPLSVTAATLLAFGLALEAPAAPLVYVTTMSGDQENPPNTSAGTGTATVVIDPDAMTMAVSASFSGLEAGVTIAHIHCCVDPPGNVGVATTTPTFPEFPMGVTEGSYDRLFDLLDAGTWNPSFVFNNGGTTASATAALLAGLAAGQAYFNIHTIDYPPGEIRGFFAPVPLPASVWLLGTAVLGLLGRRLRRRE